MKLLDEVIEKPFDLDRFIRFTCRLFNVPESTDTGEIFHVPEYAFNFRVINRLTYGEGTVAAVLAVNSDGNCGDVRYGLLLKKQIGEILASISCETAIAAFYEDGAPEWKLSLIRLTRDIKVSDDTRLLKTAGLSSVSYMLGGGGGPGASVITDITRTAARKQLLRLLTKKGQRTLEDLEKAFGSKAFKRDILKLSNERYADNLDYSSLVKQPGFKMNESEPYDRVLAMDPEILGDLFEGRLDRSERKNRGTFYTPPEIVSFMCRESLAHYVSNAVDIPYEDCRSFLDTDGSFDDGGEEGLPAAIIQSYKKIDDALKRVRILDPAAGSGAFVIGMLKEIVRVRTSLSVFIADDLSYRHPYRLMLHTVMNCIYAADIEEDAIGITRLRLWCALASAYGGGLPGMPGLAVIPGSALSETCLFSHVITGSCLNGNGKIFDNSLAFMEIAEKKGGFDIVIGNPPYISAVEAAKYGDLRRSLKAGYPLLSGSFDVYAAFLLEGLRQTNEKGVYCWIVPNSLLASRYASPVLEHLKKNGLKQSYSVSDAGIFHNIGVYPVIVVGNKGLSGGGYAEYAAASAEGSGCMFIRRTRSFKTYGTFKDHGIRFASGTAGFQAKALAAFITEKPVEGSIPFVVSGSIDKYSVGFDNIRYMGKTYENAFITKSSDIAHSKWRLWCGGKIVIAGLTRELEADYCRNPLALGVGAYALYDFGGFDPLFLLGLLNSRFMSEYIREQFHEKHLAGGYLAINKATLEQLPLESADPELQRTVAEKAGAIKALLEQLHGMTLENGKVQGPETQGIKLKYEGLLSEIDELADWFYGR